MDVARPPPASATVGAGPSSGAAWSSAMRTGQPPAGASPATAMSPPSPTSTPPRDGGGGGCRAVARECLRRRAEIELDARGIRERSPPPRRARRVCQPGTAPKRAPRTCCRRARRRRGRSRRTRRCAMRGRQWDRRGRRCCAPPRSATRSASSSNGPTETLLPPRASLTCASSLSGAEAAARAIDRVELALDCRARDRPRSARRPSRSPPSCRERGRRGSRAAGDDDGRRLGLHRRRCGRGRRCGALCRRRAAAGVAARCLYVARGRVVACTVWWPGSALAASPAKAATSAPAAASVIDVVRRRRRSA